MVITARYKKGFDMKLKGKLKTITLSKAQAELVTELKKGGCVSIGMSGSHDTGYYTMLTTYNPYEQKLIKRKTLQAILPFKILKRHGDSYTFDKRKLAKVA